jgi:hypothetical protein
MLILAVAEYLNKLFQDSCLTSIASLGELGGVMEVAIDFPFMFVVAVRSSEDCGTD